MADNVEMPPATEYELIRVVDGDTVGRWYFYPLPWDAEPLDVMPMPILMKGSLIPKSVVELLPR